MALPEVLEAFAQERALPVMVRAVLERAFSDSVFDMVFDRLARQQHARKLLFSTCVSLMAKVVTRVQPTLGAAIRNHEDLLPVGRDCVYDKIAGLEEQVVATSLAITASDLAKVVDEVQGALPALVPGRRTLVLDANHLRAVQHRIQPLRGLRQAALPGTCVALLDAQRKLFCEVFWLEDGHSSELTALPAVAEKIQFNDLVLADRNLCTREFAATVEDRGAYFLVRQHSSRFPVELLGEREYVGKTSTGHVYEQQARYCANGAWKLVRRITIELFGKTRDDEAVLHVLTNVPTYVVDPATRRFVKIDAITLAEGYRSRWTIETAFRTLTVDLNCELNTLAYPPAALFAFTVAAMCYNAYSTALAALRGHFGAERVEREFSTYYLANDVRALWEGMRVSVPDHTWASLYGTLSIQEFAQHLLELARRVDPRRYRKAPPRPRRPPVKGASQRAKCKHTSVAKELKKHEHKC